MKAILTLVFLIVTQLAFGQDIVLSSTTLPIDFDSYEEIVGNLTVTNSGIVPITGSFTVSYYLSTNNSFENTDIRLGNTQFSGLKAGESVTDKAYISYLAEIPPATYYCIYVIDHFNEITETDETNNQFVVTNVTVTSPNYDLTFTSFSLDKTAYTANEKIGTTFTIENIGATNVLFSLSAEFFLSQDQNLSADDKYMARVGKYLTGPDIFLSSEDNTTLFIPSVPAGAYYVIGKVDPSARFSETDEDNNAVIQAVTVQDPDIDLEITDIMNSFFNTSPVSFFVTLRNNGTTGVGGFQLSGIATTEITPEFLSFYFDSNSYLEPGESEQFLVHTSTYLSPGIYSLELTVNRSHAIVETNYANNAFTSSVNIPPPPTYPSLTLNSIAFAGTYDNTDNDLVLNLNVTNSGTAISYPQNYLVELKDASNAIVHSQTSSMWVDFSYGSSAVKPIAITLITPLPPGEYQTTISCDGACNTYPSSSTTSLPISQVQYTLTGTIQGEDGTPINRGSLFLYQKGDDGVVKFIQKITPTTTSDFSFQIDNHEHTLYFIPDRVDYPTYVPTIYGKTLVLQESNFFTLTENSALTFEILKVKPLAPGPGIINGAVTQPDPYGSPTGRKATTDLPVADVPILLLSSSGDVVGYTHTNESGFYEFINLPRDNYQVIPLRELDLITLPQPHDVSIVSRNMTVDFNLGHENIAISDNIFLLGQHVTFSSVPQVKFGQAPVPLDAISDSGLPIYYSSSNSAIAEVIDGFLSINMPGSVTLTAKQAGNDFYLPAEESQTIVIGKGDQMISFAALPSKTYGDGPFTPTISSSTALPLVLTSSDPSIASISDNKIVIHGAGAVVISATQHEDDFYNAAQPVAHSLIIAKATQTIVFQPLVERDISEGNFELVASTNSLLIASFTSDNEQVATINGNVVSVHGAGVTHITAIQNGNANYTTALPVTQTLVINQVTGIEDLVSGISVYPNPVMDFIYLNNVQGIERIDAIDGLGRLIPEIWTSGNTIDFRDCATGVYTLKVKSTRGTQTIRIVKK